MEIIGFLVLTFFLFVFVFYAKEVWGTIKRGEKLEISDYLKIGFTCFILVSFLQALGVIVIIIGAVAWYLVPKDEQKTDDFDQGT